MSEIDIREITGEPALDEAYAIRRAVFCVEQGVPETLEIDGKDDASRHYLVRLSCTPVGTARVREVSPGVAKIERVAVLAPYRGTGLGQALIRRLLEDLAKAGANIAVLHAQQSREGFYATLGFISKGAPFDEAGIPHVKMTQTLNTQPH